MKIQRVQNNNQNFTALRINKPKIDWNANVLLDFVKNKEVQKFVSSMDSIDRDVYASCLSGKTIAIDIIRKNDSNYGIQLPQFRISELEKFSFRKFYQAFENLSGEKIVSNERETVVTNDKKIYSTREGYNKIASHYDTWKWQNFWTENEMPLIIRWSENKKNSYGADFGVGTGRNLKILLANNNKIDGFDVSEEMIKICQQKYSDYIDNEKLTCYNSSVFEINNPNHKYDWIISNRMMSNIKDVEKFIQILQKCIKTGGECFISDVHPDRNYAYTHMNVDDNDIYIETYKHSIPKIKQLFEKYNFEIIEYKEFLKDNLKLTDTIKTDTKPIFYYFILKYNG